MFLILGLCYHYYGGIIPLCANFMATVTPSLSYNSGSCYHSLGGITLQNKAISIAAVRPFLF